MPETIFCTLHSSLYTPNGGPKTLGYRNCWLAVPFRPPRVLITRGVAQKDRAAVKTSMSLLARRSQCRVQNAECRMLCLPAPTLHSALYILHSNDGPKHVGYRLLLVRLQWPAQAFVRSAS